MNTDLLLGPFALTVGLLIAVYAFFTGRIRRESEVTKLEKQLEEKDKRIDVLASELTAERTDRLEEQRLRRDTKAVLSAVVPEEAKPPHA